MIPIVIDTNIVFSAIYNKKGLERKLIDYIISHQDIQLFAPPIFWKEIKRTLNEKLDYELTEIEEFLSIFSIIKVPYKNYKRKIGKAKELINHRSDIPFVAVALFLNAPIWSGNIHHFEQILESKDIVWFNSRRLSSYLKEKKMSQG